MAQDERWHFQVAGSIERGMSRFFTNSRELFRRVVHSYNKYENYKFSTKMYILTKLYIYKNQLLFFFLHI